MAFAHHLSAALHTASQANTPKTSRGKDNVFARWTRWAEELGIRPDLSDITERDAKLGILLAYGHQHRIYGALGRQPRDEPNRAGSVMGVLASVGQGIANLGLPDPRLNPATGRLHDILTDFRRRMETEDSPASRVAPCSLTVLRYLHNILDTDHPREGKFNAHVIDLCIVGFYFMLRPGEFCRGDAENRSSPFRLCDITFTMGNRNLSSSNPRLNDVEESAITTVTLTFTDQKNAVRGEQIAHSRTSDPVYCPVKALYRITRHLRACGVPDDTPIYAFPRSSGATAVQPSHVTNALRHTAEALRAQLGIDPFTLSSKSLRPGGATALLCSGALVTDIMLIGRWHSDSVFRYLRAQTLAQTRNYAESMLQHGQYTFVSGTHADDNNLPQEVPGDVLEALHPVTP